MEIRRAMKATSWGSKYIVLLYVSKAILIALAIALSPRPVINIGYAYVTGYFSLMCVREIVTLKLTFELQQICRQSV
jgi:hypothetical protein